jgi:hypothetical protein
MMAKKILAFRILHFLCVFFCYIEIYEISSEESQYLIIALSIPFIHFWGFKPNMSSSLSNLIADPNAQADRPIDLHIAPPLYKVLRR